MVTAFALFGVRILLVLIVVPAAVLAKKSSLPLPPSGWYAFSVSVGHMIVKCLPLPTVRRSLPSASFSWAYALSTVLRDRYRIYVLALRGLVWRRYLGVRNLRCVSRACFHDEGVIRLFIFRHSSRVRRGSLSGDLGGSFCPVFGDMFGNRCCVQEFIVGALTGN